MQGAFAFYQPQPARPARAERLFFCIRPPADVARAAHALGRHLTQAPRLAPERLHLSLFLVADENRLAPTLLHAAIEAGRRIHAAPFDIALSTAMSFDPLGPNRRHPLVLIPDNRRLLDLRSELVLAATDCGINTRQSAWDDDLVPHMTLAYAAEPLAPRAIDLLHFRAEEFVLLHSRRGFAQHIEKGRWRLKG